MAGSSIDDFFFPLAEQDRKTVAQRLEYLAGQQKLARRMVLRIARDPQDAVFLLDVLGLDGPPEDQR